jgi:Ni/Co efflux regulator RcnB
MPKFLAFMLLASAASAPALAAGEPGDRHGGWMHHDSGQQSQSDKGNRPNGDRPHFNRGNDGGDSDAGQHQQVQPQPTLHVESNNGGSPDSSQRRHFSGFVNRNSSDDQAPSIQPIGGNQDAPDSVRNWRGEERRHINTGPKIVEAPGGGETLRQSDHPIPRVFHNRIPIVSNQPREGTQPPLRVDRHRTTQTVNWSTSHWRNDHRYDWQNHRHHHRSLFHLGIYYDPFGWNYRPYQIGWRLWPNYYSSNYWINDPWQYRLPYAPPGYRWIRYYDDALLIDTWNGEVVDVIYNFFW